MPTYKDMWYADITSPINPSAISATEATSAGDKIEILEKALPTKVTSSAARNELYPNPVQGDSVYRLDLGFEERYYETYNSKNNLGGKPSSGWYRVNSGPKEITVSPTIGSGYIQYNNVFTSDYTFWKINYDVSTTVPSVPSNTNLNFRFTAASSEITTAQYYYTRIGTSSAGTSSATAASGNAFILGLAALGTGSIHGGEITLSDIYTKNYPKFIHNGYHARPTGTQVLSMVHGYYNSTSTTIDGFRIYTQNGSELIANITITGYN